MKPVIGIIMGSDSDLPTMEGAKQALKEMNLGYEVQIVSAHRTPKLIEKYVKSVEKRKFKVIIAGAGGAAHLPGMVASYTTLPVIGVPICVGKLKGLDALLSVVQMPKGVPVASVAIDNSFNAGLLAARILGYQSKALTAKLKKFQSAQKNKVLKANKNIT